jgi:hypothetical protein
MYIRICSTATFACASTLPDQELCRDKRENLLAPREEVGRRKWEVTESKKMLYVTKSSAVTGTIKRCNMTKKTKYNIFPIAMTQAKYVLIYLFNFVF